MKGLPSKVWVCFKEPSNFVKISTNWQHWEAITISRLRKEGGVTVIQNLMINRAAEKLSQRKKGSYGGQQLKPEICIKAGRRHARSKSPIYLAS